MVFFVPVVQVTGACAREGAYAGTLSAACQRADNSSSRGATTNPLDGLAVSLTFVRMI